LKISILVFVFVHYKKLRESYGGEELTGKTTNGQYLPSNGHNHHIDWLYLFFSLLKIIIVVPYRQIFQKIPPKKYLRINSYVRRLGIICSMDGKRKLNLRV